MTNTGESNAIKLYNGQPVTNGITAGVEERKQRGLLIAAVAKIEKQNGVYLVPSQTSPKHQRYHVKYHKDHPTCDCPDFHERGCRCKHVYAVEFFRQRELEVHPDGSVTVTESVTITQKRKTYPQDWPNYNKAQCNEKRHFLELLRDVCSTIEEPKQDKPRRGRPAVRMADAVFAVVSKVYSTRSGRRFSCDLAEAKESGLIEHAPHYNSCFRYIENPDLFPILVDLIQKSALPLADVETQFAVDSTGFAFCRFTKWFDIKYNRFTEEQQWVKAHIACGTKTNVVTSIVIKDRDTNDSPQLPALVNETAKNFNVQEVSADKGYIGEDNLQAIAKIGAKPFIMFKDNATGGIGGLFRKVFHYFQFKREEFLQHYHRRSNIESTVMMIKSKFGDAVRSKSEVAAKNEVLCKVLCHNLCCLISAMYELGIVPALAGRAAPKIENLPHNSGDFTLFGQ
jgi:transposase